MDTLDIVRASVHSLHPALGAEVEGIDVRAATRPGDLDLIVETAYTRGVVVLRGQNLTEDDLGQLVKRIDPDAGYRKGHVGGFHAGASYVTSKIRSDGVFNLTNLSPDGILQAPDSIWMRKLRANELWHTDSTYMKPRATLSFLYARAVPPTGGETEFCDTRVAYAELDPAYQARLEPMIAHHSLRHSRQLSGFSEWTKEEETSLVSIPRPLIQRHEPTGRMALCLASHIEAIDGLSADECAALVADLTARASASDRVHSHRWQAGDLVIWDNRCTMHRGRPYDPACVRDLLTVRLWDAEDV